MAKLYVANTTKQNQRVYFRLDFDVDAEGRRSTILRFQPAKYVDIPPGQQRVIGGEIHQDQVESIVEQLRPYGLAGVTEVASLAAVTPYIFNLNQPVKADHIRYVMAKNEGLQIEEGRQRRAKAAIIMNETVSNAVANQFAQQGIQKEPVQDFEVEFEQLDQSEAGEKRIEEGYRIDPNAPPPPAAAKAAKRKAAAKPKASAQSRA
jgi:hypothetical protein